MHIRNRFCLLLLTTLPFAAIGAQEDLSAEELQARIDQARTQLDEAARELGELHRQQYRTHTLGIEGRKPMLGLLLGNQAAEGGIEIVGVTPGGGADQAGLAAGDRLLAVNGYRFDDSNTRTLLHDAMEDVEPGDSVSVEYARDGGIQYAEVITQTRGAYMISMMGDSDFNFDFRFDGLKKLEKLGELKQLGELSRLEALRELQHLDLSELEELEDLEDLHELHENRIAHVPRIPAGRAIFIANGLQLVDADSELAAYFGVDKGVLVIRSDQDSALKGGDVLLAIDGEPVNSSGQAYRKLHSGAEDALVDVMRQGLQSQITVPRPGITNTSRLINRQSIDRRSLNIATPIELN